MADTDLNVTDQNAMTAEETAALAAMAAGDGATGDDTGGNTTPTETPAAASKGAKGAEAEGDKGKMVPYGALAEERGERKKLETTLQTEREERIKLNERVETLLKTLGPKPPEAPKEEPIPDFAEDPAGWIAGTMKKTGKTLEQLTGEITAMKTEKAEAEKLNTQRASMNEFLSDAVAQENTFKAATPDYDAASKFLLDSRVAELQEMGWDDKQITGILNNERLAIAQRAKQTGKNPAAVVYAIAKQRGYKAAERHAAAPAKTDAEKLEIVRRGQDMSTSLSSVGGKGPTVLTAESLAKMSDEEFARVIETPEGRALLGR